MFYDPDKDRSEEFGWKKWCDERKPSEEEQNRWSKISALVAAKVATLGLLLEI